MPPPRTRMTGVIPRRPQVRTAAASSTGRTRLRRRSSRRGPPPSFYPRPGLLLPHLDRAVVALDGPPRAQLASPAAAAAAGTRSPDGVLHPELPATRSRTRASVHRWSSHPAASGPASSASIQRGQLLLIQPALRRLPPGRQPGQAASLPGLPPPPHRPLADPQLRGDHRGRRPLLESLPASSRTCSRRLRPSAVSPPPCAYRMHPAYRRKPHTSAQRTSPIKDL